MVNEHREAVHAICRRIWNREISADEGLEELEDVIDEVVSVAEDNICMEMSERD